MEQPFPDSKDQTLTAERRSGFWSVGPETLLIAAALAAPWSIAAMQMATMAGALLILIGVGSGKLPYPRLPWTLAAVPVFLAVQALSIPFGVHPGRSLGCFRGSWVLLFPLIYWGLARNSRSRRRTLAALVWSGAAAGCYGVLQHFLGLDYLHHRALENYGGGGYVAVGNLNSHLTYSGVLLPVFFVALGFLLEERRWWWWTPPALVLGLALLFGFARTAWLGAAFALMTLGFWRGRRTFIMVLGALALVAAGMALAEPALRERALSILQVGNDPRSRLWRSALIILAHHPWIGAGLGAFKTQFPLYKVPGTYLSTIHPHNDLLNVMVETGILGGLAWLSIWILFFRETRSPAAGTDDAGRWRGSGVGLLDGLRAAVAALLFAGLGQCFSTDEEVAEVWYLVLAIALGQALELRSRPRSPALPRSAKKRNLSRRLQRAFKDTTLPLAARLFGPPPGRTTFPRSNRSSTTSDGLGPQRILVVRQDNRLGNLLLLTPFLQRLRQAAPRAHIALLSGEVYAPLLRGWPWIDQSIVQEKRRHACFPWLFLPWIANLRRPGWDLAIEASNPDTHSYYNCLLALLSGAPVRVGFNHPRSASVLTQAVSPPPARTHFSLASLSLLRARGWSAPAATMSCPLVAEPSERFVDWRRRSGADQFPLVIHLGGREEKAWPLQAWAQLLPRLLEEWPGQLVLVAGPEEQSRLSRLLRSPAPRLVRAPRLRLIDLAHLLRDAAGFLGCDSGVMHLAASLGTPTVALFFASNPYAYAPLGPSHRTVLLANPYGVTPQEWEMPVEGMIRSRLFWAESKPEAPFRGEPETGPRAVAVVAGAVLELPTRPAGTVAGEERS
jgi:heptosyltransferase III